MNKYTFSFLFYSTDLCVRSAMLISKEAQRSFVRSVACLSRESTLCTGSKLSIPSTSTVTDARKKSPKLSLLLWVIEIFPLAHRKVLTSKCREKEGELYCLRCFDSMESSICSACRWVL